MQIGMGVGIDMDPCSTLSWLSGASMAVDFRTQPALPTQITFTRASAGTYVAMSGQILEATTDTARLTYDGFTGEGLGILVEQVGTNLQIWSEDFSNAAHSATAGYISESNDTTMGVPVARFVTSDTGTVKRAAGLAVTSGQTYTISRVIKRGTTAEVKLTAQAFGGSDGVTGTFDLSTGSVVSYAAFGTGWTAVEARVKRMRGDYFRLSIVVTTGGTSMDVIQSFGDLTTDVPANDAYLPAGLNWPLATYPIPLTLSGSTYDCAIDPRDYVNPAIWTGPLYYVDIATGNNSNTGLGSYANAVKGISQAITLGNAGGVPFRVLVKAGRYSREWSIKGNATTIQPTQDCAIMADAGRVVHPASTDWTFPGSVHGTYTNSYVGGPANALRIFDRLAVDANGDFVELAPVADAAAVDSTPNSWATVAGVIHIRRTDGLQPTMDNTLICRSMAPATFTSTKQLYVENFDFEGGSSSAFGFDPNAAARLVMSGCTYKYAGSASTSVDNLEVNDVDGLVLLYNCRASKGSKDGLNFHTFNAGLQTYLLTIGCKGIANGRLDGSSNNGLTIHEDIIAVDINGEYRGSLEGDAVAIIQDSKMALFGTVIDHTVAEGQPLRGCVFIDNTAQMWMDGCALTSDGRAAVIRNTGTLRTQRTSVTGEISAVSGTTYTTNWIDAVAYMTAAQVETGTQTTSYIRTSGASATRAADDPKWLSTNFTDNFDPNEGAVFVTVPELPPAGYEARFMTIGDGTADNRIWIRRDASGALTVNMVSGGATQQTATLPGTFTSGPLKMAMAWSATAQKTRIAAGGVVSESATITTWPTGINQADIGSGHTTGGEPRAAIGRVSSYKGSPSNIWMQTVTS